MKKHFKLLVTLCVVAFVLALSAAAATDFTGYTKISTADELLKLMNSSSAVTGKYYLANDITLTGTQSPIGEPDGKSFGLASAETAIFDGNGHTVKGVNISGASYVGFFCVVDNAEIRNLTIEGSVTSSGSNSGALVAYAKTSLVIENCVNNCTFTTTSASTGSGFGGILGNTEVSSLAKLTISGCTNNKAISAYRVAGGIVGWVQCKSNAEILIEACVNNGAVTAICTSNNSKIGGILGILDSTKPKSFTVTQCRNAAEVKGRDIIGGIIGVMSGNDKSATNVYGDAKFHVTECWNDGAVTATNTDSNRSTVAGGIIGAVKYIGDVRDCLNTGTVSSPVRRIGGLFGQVESTSYFFGAKNNLNRADIKLNNVVVYDNDYVNSIGGYLAYKPYGTNYYTGTLQGKVWENTTTGAKSTQYNSTLFEDLNESGNWVNADAPVLDVFKEAYCAKYGHKSVSFTKGTGSVVFTCAACETGFYIDTTVETTVYVDETNGVLAVNASEDKDIGTSTVPFKSLTEAFEYAAVAAEVKDTDVTINIVGTATLADSYETPETEKTITVTGGTFHFGGALVANRQIYLGGPVVFENITFTSAAVEARIYAQNNKLVMGEGIKMANASSTAATNSSIPFKVNNVKMFVIGGFASDIPDSGMATDITVRSGEYYIVAGWNYTSSTAATKGTSRVTVGKTNANDTLKICDLTPYNIGVQTRAAADINATMIIDGDADVARLMLSERERTTNEIEANYTTNLVLRGSINESYRDAYMAPYGFDITGGGHTDSSLGYHTFRIFTDARVDGAVYAEHAFFGGDGFAVDETLTTGGYKPVSEGGDVTMTKHSYMEYCITYMDGHTDSDDADTLCDECGADTACAHENASLVVTKEANCTETGYAYTFCGDCAVTVNEGATPIVVDAHNYVWEAFEGGYRYVCSYNEEHVHSTYGREVTEFYVSDNGKANGGFAANYPSNDFDAVMKLAAASENDVTVYIMGSITLKNNSDTDYEVYIEPEHENTITVRGYGDISGIIQMGSRNTRLEYMLSGDTTFEQVEFNTGVTKNAIYIVARHNTLVMGERISTSFGRYNGDSSANSGKLIVIGGCDNTVDGSACAKENTDVTFKSGTYYMVICGSSGKGCGLVNGTINVNVLGDITVGGVVTSENGFTDRQFILGSHSADVGDIVAVIDGNVTCVNAFCVGSYGIKTVNDESVCRSAGDVTIILKRGLIVDYSFSGRSSKAIIYDEEFAQSYNPSANALDTADVVVFPIGNSHSHAIRGGVMNFIDNLYVNYNASDDAASHVANRMRIYLGGSDNFHMDVIPADPCTSTSGRHTPSGSGTVVLEATCRGEGSVEYVCSICGAQYAQSIERLAHDYSVETLFSEANCTSPAIYVSVCQNEDCGFKRYNSVGEATAEHVFEDGVCKYCNESKQTLCAHENLGDVEEFVSGCGVGTKQTCADCGKEFITVDSADHSFGAFTVTVEPTDTTPGVKSRSCRRCGKTETALMYAEGGAALGVAVATNADGSLSDVSVDLLKLSSTEKAALNALLQDTSYGSEVKVSYVAKDAGTSIVYSIPLPTEYAAMHNLKIVVKDDNGTLHTVDFKVEKGYIVFEF